MLGGLARRASGRIAPFEKRFIPGEERPAVIAEARIYPAIYAGTALVMVVSQWWTPLWFWRLPLFMGEPVMRSIRMTEHVGRPNSKDMTVNARTTLVSWPWRFLAWNMPCHAEHHYASPMPFHALPKPHKKLKGQLYTEPRGYLAAHADMLGQLTSRHDRLGARVNADAC